MPLISGLQPFSQVVRHRFSCRSSVLDYCREVTFAPGKPEIESPSRGAVASSGRITRYSYETRSGEAEVDGGLTKSDSERQRTLLSIRRLHRGRIVGHPEAEVELVFSLLCAFDDLRL